ncbi:hypothetical protein ACW95P_02645 [Candidatus Mycoplasma pogonae]
MQTTLTFNSVQWNFELIKRFQGATLENLTSYTYCGPEKHNKVSITRIGELHVFNPLNQSQGAK